MALAEEVSGHCAARFALQPRAGQGFPIEGKKGSDSFYFTPV